MVYDNNEKVVLVLMDCLRVDQLKAMTTQLAQAFHLEMELKTPNTQ